MASSATRSGSNDEVEHPTEYEIRDGDEDDVEQQGDLEGEVEEARQQEE